MTFNQLIEQTSLIEEFKHTSESNTLPHAMLIHGPEGFGSFQFAWAASQWIFCENKTANDACGICPNCKKVSKLQHPDLHLFFPTAGAKETVAERMNEFRTFVLGNDYFDIKDWMSAIASSNKTANINKLIIKEIADSFDYKSYLGGARIIVVWAAEYMGSMGNKLLKLIEEPPENSYIFLVSADKEKILGTIRSRCQLLELKGISASGIRDYLTNKNTAIDNIEQVTQIANGNIIEAQRLLEGGYNEISKRWLSFLRISFRGHPVELINLCNEIGSSSKEELRALLKYGLLYCQAILKTKTGIPITGFEQVDKLAPYLSTARLFELINRLDKDYYHISRNANSKILMTALGLYVNELFH